MKEVMWKRALKAKIATDSLKQKKAYGLGPVEFLKGEVILFEGQTYVSKVIDSVSHQVNQVPSVGAPFLYTSISSLWFVFLSIKWIVDFTIGFFKGVRLNS